MWFVLRNWRGNASLTWNIFDDLTVLDSGSHLCGLCYCQTQRNRTELRSLFEVDESLLRIVVTLRNLESPTL